MCRTHMAGPSISVMSYCWPFGPAIGVMNYGWPEGYGWPFGPDKSVVNYGWPFGPALSIIYISVMKRFLLIGINFNV